MLVRSTSTSILLAGPVVLPSLTATNPFSTHSSILSRARALSACHSRPVWRTPRRPRRAVGPQRLLNLRHGVETATSTTRQGGEGPCDLQPLHGYNFAKYVLPEQHPEAFICCRSAVLVSLDLGSSASRLFARCTVNRRLRLLPLIERRVDLVSFSPRGLRRQLR